MYTKSKVNSNGNFNVKAAVINSGTTLTDGALFDVSTPAYLVISGTAVGTAIVTPVLADGTPGGAPSQTIQVSIVTPTIISFTAPVPFTGLRVSPTATLAGANTVTAKIIQAK